MEKIFNTLIEGYISNNIGISPDFLSADLAHHLRNHLMALHHKGQFKSAGIGEGKSQHQDQKFRGDEIYWLDRAHNDIHENSFLDVIDAFILYLNATCFTGISSYEFHYTLYPTGTFYKKHLDQFKTNDSRKFSMIIYLNTDWIEADGGELCVYPWSGLQTISPNSGKGVFFKSNEMEHEVLTTHQPRMSITGWLKA